MQTLYLDELIVGSTFESGRRTLTESDLVLFVSLTGLHERMFRDVPYSVEHYGGLVIPAPLLLAYALGLTEELFSGAARGFLGIDKARFRRVCHPGDTISVKTTVLEARPSTSKPETGIGRFEHVVMTAEAPEIASFERTMLLARSVTGKAVA